MGGRRHHLGRGGSAAAAGLAASLLVLVAPVIAPVAYAQTDNVCDAGEAPDLIVGDIHDVARWGEIDGISAYSVGTSACNLGSCGANWIPNTADHPITAHNLFRLENGRFEQLGQSWNTHLFFALAQPLCATPENACVPPATGNQLGVFCSDTTSANVNGYQFSMGPKSEASAATGAFDFPFTGQGESGNLIFKRLQVRTEEIDPALHPDAVYFVETQYIALDDAAAGNQNNNVSHRELIVVDGGGNPDFLVTGETKREVAAIFAWEGDDPGAKIVTVDVPDDPPGCSLAAGSCGRLFVGFRVTDLGTGRWRYEYAVHNLTSDRSVGAFTVPLPVTAQLTNVGFHDVDYHSGEPFDGTDWTPTIDEDSITWTTVPFADNPDANALRWGTLYNFRYDASVPPGAVGAVTLGLFTPGTPGSVSAAASFPALCSVGTDGDNDTFGACDCDDGDADVWGAPGEVRDLLLSKDDVLGSVLSWTPPTQLGGTSVVFETLRSDDPADFVDAAVCLSDPGSDDVTPVPGQIFAYLVRARSGCVLTGVGTLGARSDGVEREGTDCP
ncbi:MAG: hypothetical protein R3344_09520, partial [Acidobacteriota bacterium]|nr:hypothetical protein [Acidobacteriota bacterium]